MKKISLKQILKEGYAWEREPGAPLPKLQDVVSKYNKSKKIEEQRNQHSILKMVEDAEDKIQNLRSNMATNSVLQREEKMEYLQAYNELLDILSDIGYEITLELGLED
jgi:hypothetical protein